ncbi:Endothelin-converting enzyme 2 [Desmophyllum pertusum]|uniref:Endothelin-converting enzyme 2 n=1 Tax=Desmophyllum pertusum TaxID=174260 RepID=A0A9X0CQ75_9CNID|nr:Endothelin-converting enzyme 2 [Desmophyllum pertusum]
MSLSRTVDTLPWMSDDTKVNAIEKANAIAEDIGYPSYIKNPSELASKIKGLKVEADKLFETIVNAKGFIADLSYSSLDKPVDREQWFFGPVTSERLLLAEAKPNCFPGGHFATTILQSEIP